MTIENVEITLVNKEIPSLENLPENARIILVLGIEGSGKTSVINTFLNLYEHKLSLEDKNRFQLEGTRKEVVSEFGGATKETTKVQAYSLSLDNQCPLVFIDTPPNFDKIPTYLQQQKRAIDGILLVLPNSTNRIGVKAQTAIDLAKMFKNEYLPESPIFVAATHADSFGLQCSQFLLEAFGVIKTFDFNNTPIEGPVLVEDQAWRPMRKHEWERTQKNVTNLAAALLSLPKNTKKMELEVPKSTEIEVSSSVPEQPNPADSVANTEVNQKADAEVPKSTEVEASSSIPGQPNPVAPVANAEVNQKLFVDTKLENLLKNNQDLISLINKFKDIRSYANERNEAGAYFPERSFLMELVDELEANLSASIKQLIVSEKQELEKHVTNQANILSVSLQLFFDKAQKNTPSEEDIQRFKKNWIRLAQDENYVESNSQSGSSSSADPENRNKGKEDFFVYMKNSEPRTSNLYRKIEVMRGYGQKLSSADQNKGKLVIELAQNLENKLDVFLRKAVKEQLSDQEIDLFKQDFEKTIKDKEPELSQHREQWKPIAANILIALTGVGLLAQIIKFVAHAYEASQQKKSLSFNEALFFGKPKSQQLSEEIKDTMGLLKNDSLNPSAMKLQ